MIKYILNIPFFYQHFTTKTTSLLWRVKAATRPFQPKRLKALHPISGWSALSIPGMRSSATAQQGRNSLAEWRGGGVRSTHLLVKSKNLIFTKDWTGHTKSHTEDAALLFWSYCEMKVNHTSSATETEHLSSEQGLTVHRGTHASYMLVISNRHPVQTQVLKIYMTLPDRWSYQWGRFLTKATYPSSMPNKFL